MSRASRASTDPARRRSWNSSKSLSAESDGNISSFRKPNSSASSGALFSPQRRRLVLPMRFRSFGCTWSRLRLPSLLRLERRHAQRRELVGALVLRMAGMALHPVPVTLWRRLASSSACHSSAFLTGFLSAVFQPLRFQPSIQLADAVPDIVAVGVEIDLARLLQRVQRRDRGHQLHAVVGGLGLAARKFLRSSPLKRRIAPQPPGPGLPEQAPSVKISTLLSCGQSVFGGGSDLPMEAQLADIFERVALLHQRAVGDGQPVVEAGQHEAQRRAAREHRQRLFSASVKRPHRLVAG